VSEENRDALDRRPGYQEFDGERVAETVRMSSFHVRVLEYLSVGFAPLLSSSFDGCLAAKPVAITYLRDPLEFLDNEAGQRAVQASVIAVAGAARRTHSGAGSRVIHEKWKENLTPFQQVTLASVVGCFAGRYASPREA